MAALGGCAVLSFDERFHGISAAVLGGRAVTISENFVSISERVYVSSQSWIYEFRYIRVEDTNENHLREFRIRSWWTLVSRRSRTNEFRYVPVWT
jgi:hypothetical protein